MAERSEQMMLSLLPTNTVREAMGFFAPVTKKYLPVFEQFNAEYLAATNRIAVLGKYMPKAEAAYRDAQKMKVPAKYEPRKQEYLKTFGRLLTVMRLTVAVAEQAN